MRLNRGVYNARVGIKVLLAAAFALSCALAACGGSSHNDAQSPPVAHFQPAAGKTIADLRHGLPSEVLLAPTVSVLAPGENRFGFGLFDSSHRQIDNASVAVYVERSGTAHVDGPFVATHEPLVVEARYQSETVRTDPSAAKGLYVTHVRFPTAGAYVVQGIAKVDGRMLVSIPMPVEVSAHDAVPDVGALAPRVHTPTVASAHGDVASIDTRQPPDTMHDVDLYNVLGKKPVILLFATPALCQSRVCGPVTDLAEELKATTQKVAFIHNEIYLGNTIKPGCLEGTRPQSQCVRPQVIAYHLPSEPWLFAIDRHGRIVARLEGAYDKQELEAAIQRAER